VRAFWLGSNPQVAASQEDLLQQLLTAGPPADGAPLRLQCFPRSLEAWLGDQLLGWNLQPVNPSWVLHIVTLPEQRQQPQQFLYSLQPAAELYNYSAVRGKRVPDQLSKAAGKLAEALAATGLQLTTGVAVDLGAAPGKRWQGCRLRPCGAFASLVLPLPGACACMALLIAAQKPSALSFAPCRRMDARAGPACTARHRRRPRLPG
jgi:hypothetical protein